MEKEKLDSRLTQNCGPVKSPVDHTERRLALGNAARQFLDLLLLGATGLGLLGLGSGLLAGGALQYFTFLFVFDLGGICHLVPLSFESLQGSHKSGRYNPYVSRDLMGTKAAWIPAWIPWIQGKAPLPYFQRTMKLDLNIQRPDSA